jgi:hypothetical protein
MQVLGQMSPWGWLALGGQGRGICSYYCRSLGFGGWYCVEVELGSLEKSTPFFCGEIGENCPANEKREYREHDDEGRNN